jgi:hypothetical protein
MNDIIGIAPGFGAIPLESHEVVQTLNAKCGPKAAPLLDVLLGALVSYPVPYPVLAMPAIIIPPVLPVGSLRRPIG